MAKHKFTEQTQKQIIDIMTTITNNNIKKLEEGRTISVSDLPECINKARYLNIVQNAKEAKVVALAIFDEATDTWLAYIGWPDVRDLKMKLQEPNDLRGCDWLWLCENVRDVEQVRILGDLLEENIARQLFNDWWGEKRYKYEKPKQ